MTVGNGDSSGPADGRGLLTALRRLPAAAWVGVGVTLLALGGVGAAFVAGDAGQGQAAPDPGTSPSAEPAAPSDAPTLVAACRSQAAVVNTWDGGFHVEVTVTADADITDWSVEIALGGATVRDTWNSTLPSGATGQVTAANVDYNGVVAAGASADFGFTADGPAPAEVPTSCTTTTLVSAAPAELDDTPFELPEFQIVSGVDSPADDDWLSTDGNRIVDADGNPVWLTGANWFGFNTAERVFHGLHTVRMEDILDGAAVRGINVIRVPISTELLLEWKAGKAAVSSAVNTNVNPDLAGKTTLEVFDAFLGASKDRGLKVILDVHSAHADNMGHIATVWWSAKVSSEDFFDAWEWVAARYAHDDTIIGFDLKNEPHGNPSDADRAIWDGSTAHNNWRHVAEQLAARIQKVHPHALILVEGIEATPKAGKTNASGDHGDYDFTWWGGNLRAAKAFPVRLPVASKLVYSPHDYGPLVYNQPWFQKTFTAQSLRDEVWGPNWLYLHDEETAPLLIGEWGGRLGQDSRQDRWMTMLRDLIVDEHLAHTFWCINPNSGDTGGLLLDDWKSWDDTKYALLRPALWQDRDGRFVSLDHATPLPAGITVTQYYRDGNPAPLG